MTNILEVFEYNQHFVAMMNIINSARLNPPSKGHNHHIIPQCWFKLHNLPVDNSKDNLVLLTIEDHQKVHKLSAMCIIGSDMRSAMGFATHILHGTFSGLHHTKDTCRKISKSLKGKFKGKTPWNKGMPAWNKGKSDIYSDETKSKMSEAKKGRHWRIVNDKREWY